MMQYSLEGSNQLIHDPPPDQRQNFSDPTGRSHHSPTSSRARSVVGVASWEEAKQEEHKVSELGGIGTREVIERFCKMLRSRGRCGKG